MLIRDNVYGTLEQDAWRRDFTMNSLYYDVKSASIIDYTQGVADVKQRLIRMIGDPDTRYKEDPVRMLRAIRFSAKLNFAIAPETAEPMQRLSGLIRHVASSRLFEEIIKLYQCGYSEQVHRLLLEYHLFAQLFPQTNALFASDYPINALIVLALENTDIRVRAEKPVTPAFLFAVLLWFPLRHRAAEIEQLDQTDPLPALEQAMAQVIAEQNQVILIPKRHTQIIREIWVLQFQLLKRVGNKASQLLEHPRFRAAYDLLALRALAGDASLELTDWWTTFQDASEEERAVLIASIPTDSKKRRKRK